MIIDANEIKNLAPMSTSVTKLVTIAMDPDSDVNELARIIELDTALTANMLRWANSAWSGASGKIATVKDAVVRLGVSNIVKMALGTQVSEPLKGAFKGYELGENELWHHTVAAALAAENIGQFIPKQPPRAAFTAALLHDVGKLLVNRYISPEIMENIQKVITEESITYIEAERKILETDHAEVGGEVAKIWNFPEELIYAIQHHHDLNPEPHEILDIVQIANFVAKFIGIGLGVEQMNIKLSPEIPKRLGLSKAGMEGLCAVVQTEMAKAEALLGG